MRGSERPIGTACVIVMKKGRHFFPSIDTPHHTLQGPRGRDFPKKMGNKQSKKAPQGHPQQGVVQFNQPHAGPTAIQAEETIPQTSCWVDDVSYDLWKSSGGQHTMVGRGVGERYENGEWHLCHPAVDVNNHRASLGAQGITDSYGSYGMQWSSALRYGTAFGVRITSSELRSLTEGPYLVGLTPSHSFDPAQRPSNNSWVPTLLASSLGTVSVQGEQRNFAPWAGRTVEVGFVIKCGTRPGRVCVNAYVNNQPVSEGLEMRLPPDTLHLFVC